MEASLDQAYQAFSCLCITELRKKRVSKQRSGKVDDIPTWIGKSIGLLPQSQPSQLYEVANIETKVSTDQEQWRTQYLNSKFGL